MAIPKYVQNKIKNLEYDLERAHRANNSLMNERAKEQEAFQEAIDLFQNIDDGKIDNVLEACHNFLVKHLYGE